MASWAILTSLDKSAFADVRSAICVSLDDARSSKRRWAVYTAEDDCEYECECEDACDLPEARPDSLAMAEPYDVKER